MTGSSTWMLPLLLLALFVTFLQSSPVRCKGMHGFGKNVEFLEEKMKNCRDNCSSVHNDNTCKCLHLNVSQENCDIRKYFIDGLTLLRNSTLSQPHVNHLIKMLEVMPSKCPNVTFSLMSVTCKPVVSLHTFHKNLNCLKEQINSQ